MNWIKTYKPGELLPKRWVSLHWRERGRGYVALQLVLTMPWKVRLYTMSTDDIQLRHPQIAIWWERNGDRMWQPRGLRWRRDHFTHKFTRQEFMKQEAGYTQQVVTAANCEELQTFSRWPLKVGDVVHVPNPIKMDVSPFGQLRRWMAG